MIPVRIDSDTQRRTDRALCPYCEAKPASCASVKWLRGRYCCEACAGNHGNPLRTSPADESKATTRGLPDDRNLPLEMEKPPLRQTPRTTRSRPMNQTEIANRMFRY